jgi:hypothetical protein
MDLHLFIYNKVIYILYNQFICKSMYRALPDFCFEGSSLGMSTVFTGPASEIISLEDNVPVE